MSRLLRRVFHRRGGGRPLSSYSYYASSASPAAARVPVGDQPPSPPPPPPLSSSAAGTASGSTPAASAKKPWGLLKFGALAALTGAVGATGYVTYAYTLDEIDQKTSTLRSMLKYPVPEDASGFEKFQGLVYSTTMKVPVKAIELYMDVRRTIEEQVKGFTEPSADKLLPDLLPQEQNVFTLVLDLNETLVYSDWKRERGWRTFKRPGVDAFLEHLAKFYEIVVYSDQLPMYADAVLDRLDQKQCIRYRLSRAATRYLNGKHYRDLSKLNRDPSQVLYVSGQALESSLQPENCVPIKPWKLENDDTALLDLIPFLEYVAVHRPADIRPVLASYQGHDIATEFIERSKEYQRRMQEQKQHRSIWRR